VPLNIESGHWETTTQGDFEETLTSIPVEKRATVRGMMERK
jgi:hypothetical protein